MAPYRLMCIDFILDFKALFGQNLADKLSTEQTLSKRKTTRLAGRQTQSSVTSQACFTMPYPGTKLQEQCPLSCQLWRNQVENKEGPNNTTKPRAYSSNCSSSNIKATLPLTLHIVKDLDQKIQKICYSSQAWLLSGTTEIEVWILRGGMNAHTQLDQHAPVVLDGCLTPVKELIFSKV